MSLVRKNQVHGELAGNGLQKAARTDPLTVKPDSTSSDVNKAKSVGVDANGVYVKVDGKSVREAGSNRLASSPGYLSVPVPGEKGAPAIVDQATYTMVCRVCTVGSTLSGTPSKVAMSAWCDTTAKFIDVRLYDLTNAQVLAEKLNVPYSATPVIVDLGTISNWPAGTAILEVQGRKAATNGAQGSIATLAICWL